MATLIPTTRGMTVTPTGTRTGVTNPPLGQAPIVPTPVSPTAGATNVLPTAQGTGTVQNNVAVNQSTTPEGGFVPMVNTPFTDYQKTAIDSLANTPTSNPMTDWASSIFQNLGNTGTKMIGQGNDILSEYLPKANQAFDPKTMIDPYMNPYIQSVIDPALKRIQQEQDNSLNDIGSQASKVGAFGGTREGVQRGVAQGQYDLNREQTIGGLYNTGYDNAINNALNQFNAERGRNLTSAGMGQQQAATGATIASNAANNGMGAGQQGINNYVQAAQNKLAAGGLQQTQQQKDLDAVNAELKNQQDADMNRLKDLQSILGALPNSNANSITKPGLQWSDLLGTAMGQASQIDWTKLLRGA